MMSSRIESAGCLTAELANYDRISNRIVGKSSVPLTHIGIEQMNVPITHFQIESRSIPMTQSAVRGMNGPTDSFRALGKDRSRCPKVHLSEDRSR
jgi:hypothetical protein